MPRLFDPIRLGSLQLRNRIVMPPMATEYSTAEGMVSDKLIVHYAERAQVLGLLVVEHTYVATEGKLSQHQLGGYSDKLVPGLKKIADAVHLQETPIALQVTHGGGACVREICGVQPVAPSSVMMPRSTEVPRELSRTELQGVINRFSDAAQRAAEAGFDAVEIHGAHGFLLSQFLSPLTNNRNDEYGGPLENRVRLAVEVIHEIRDRLGSNYPLLYRLGAEDQLPNGLTLKEGIQAAKIIAEAGIDVIDVSGGLRGSQSSKITGPGYFVPQAAAVKKAAKVPVIGVGGIKTTQEADAIIQSRKVDLVAVGRAILRDPKWAFNAIKDLKGTF